MTALRVYDPPECDASGVPVDWERCRKCEGTGRARDPRIWGTMPGSTACENCDGHGSLKAAALYGYLRYFDGHEPEMPIRCDECGHPMSDGAWEWNRHQSRYGGTPSPGDYGPHALAQQLWALRELRDGREPYAPLSGRWAGVHFSRCDEGCRHGGPLRAAYHERGPEGTDPPGELRHGEVWSPGPDSHAVGVMTTAGELHAEWGGSGWIEASWRSVDVRTLGWPHDLRPEKLAVLCLRCWAARA